MKNRGFRRAVQNSIGSIASASASKGFSEAAIARFVTSFLFGAPWYKAKFVNRWLSSLPNNLTILFVTILTTLIPFNVAYIIKFPESSNITFVEGSADVVFSSSLSAASLAPSVIVSSLKGESGDCWDSVIVVILSSYFRRHFPVRKLKTRICLSGKIGLRIYLRLVRMLMMMERILPKIKRLLKWQYLFEVVEISFGFKFKDVHGFGEMARWFPVFYHSSYVDTDDTIVKRIVRHYMDGPRMDFVERVKRRGIFKGIVDVYIRWISVGAGYQYIIEERRTSQEGGSLHSVYVLNILP